MTTVARSRRGPSSRLLPPSSFLSLFFSPFFVSSFLASGIGTPGRTGGGGIRDSGGRPGAFGGPSIGVVPVPGSGGIGVGPVGVRTNGQSGLGNGGKSAVLGLCIIGTAP